MSKLNTAFLWNDPVPLLSYSLYRYIYFTHMRTHTHAPFFLWFCLPFYLSCECAESPPFFVVTFPDLGELSGNSLLHYNRLNYCNLFKYHNPPPLAQPTLKILWQECVNTSTVTTHKATINIY